MSALSNRIFACVFTLTIFFSIEGHAQTKNIAPLIAAWSASDTSQTHKAEISYKALTVKGAESIYNQNLSDLYKYIKQHPDPRLNARIYIYDVLGKSQFKYKATANDSQKLKEAMKIAHRLNDEQLLAEIYALTAETNFENNYLLYNLKALELQKKIGYHHFAFMHNRFFSVSLALYLSKDYRHSVDYGLKCLSFKHTDIQNWDPRVYIFQLDIIGAAYRKLNMLDSSKYYYQKILDTLHAKPDVSPRVQKLWISISNGNIGHILAMHNKFEQAIPLLQDQLQTGIVQQSWNNAAMAQNVLSEIYYKQKNYPLALSGWKKAHNWAIKSNVLDEAATASKGIADIYKLNGNTDSAFSYYNLYHKYKDSLDAEINTKRLSAVSAKIAFDNTLNDLEKTNSILTGERITRNFIFIAIALLTVIGVLFYNRQRLKQRHNTELTERNRKETEKEIEKSRERISLFASHIIEKDRLIGVLNEALTSRSDPENNTSDFTTNLLKYTLVTNAEWEKFRTEFSNAYPTFLPLLKSRLKGINPAEERLASLIYLQLNNRQIANMLGISKDSVTRSKRRLKHRFNVPADATVEDYLTNYHSQNLATDT